MWWCSARADARSSCSSRAGSSSACSRGTHRAPDRPQAAFIEPRLAAAMAMTLAIVTVGSCSCPWGRWRITSSCRPLPPLYFALLPLIVLGYMALTQAMKGFTDAAGVGSKLHFSPPSHGGQAHGLDHPPGLQSSRTGRLRPLASDPALCAAARADAGWARPALDYARRLGRADTYTLAQQANRHAPELHRFDTRGRRIDAIEFHPAWHQLMALYRGQGLVSPFREQQPGRWTAWAARFLPARPGGARHAVPGHHDPGGHSAAAARGRAVGAAQGQSCTATPTTRAICRLRTRPASGWAWA